MNTSNISAFAAVIITSIGLCAFQCGSSFLAKNTKCSEAIIIDPGEALVITKKKTPVDNIHHTNERSDIGKVYLLSNGELESYLQNYNVEDTLRKVTFKCLSTSETYQKTMHYPKK